MKTFGGFTDHFQTFDLFRGKKLDDDGDDDLERISGKFKVKYVLWMYNNFLNICLQILVFIFSGI